MEIWSLGLVHATLLLFTAYDLRRSGWFLMTRSYAKGIREDDTPYVDDLNEIQDYQIRICLLSSAL